MYHILNCPCDEGMFHDCLDDDGKCCNMCDFKAGIVGMDLLQT